MDRNHTKSLVSAILLLVTITFILSIFTKIIHVRKYLEFTNEDISQCVSREVYDTYLNTINQENAIHSQDSDLSP